MLANRTTTVIIKHDNFPIIVITYWNLETSDNIHIIQLDALHTQTNTACTHVQDRFPSTLQSDLLSSTSALSLLLSFKLSCGHATQTPITADLPPWAAVEWVRESRCAGWGDKTRQPGKCSPAQLFLLLLCCFFFQFVVVAAARWTLSSR